MHAFPPDKPPTMWFTTASAYTRTLSCGSEQGKRDPVVAPSGRFGPGSEAARACPCGLQGGTTPALQDTVSAARRQTGGHLGRYIKYLRAHE